MDNAALKNQVREFWNQHPCGNDTSAAEGNTKSYYDQIENFRYSHEPFIQPFAQFSKYKNKKVLEVGVGMGTDFFQWVKAGAIATGVDLTESGIGHVKNRLALYGLKADDLRVADAENLPFADNQFDLVYSWGVIMHTPNTAKALSEIIRVIRPGGEGKLMIYHRLSFNTFYIWLKQALLKGRPWKSFTWCLYHFQESLGTKGYSVGEIKKMLAGHPVEEVKIQTHVTPADRLSYSRKKLVRWFGSFLTTILPFSGLGWFMTIQFKKGVPH